MKRVTKAEIEEMRARGFEAHTIRNAEESERRTCEADRLCMRVRSAFADVTLGTGVGLFEGQALDDYESDAVRGEVRARDEKEDWSRIPSENLNKCSSSLFFFDPLGMRFHLPAFMIAELLDQFHHGVFSIALLGDSGRRYFAALDDSQRAVVREFLIFILGDSDCEYEQPHIERALLGYWSEGGRVESKTDP